MGGQPEALGVAEAGECLTPKPEVAAARTHLASATLPPWHASAPSGTEWEAGGEPFPQMACEFCRASPDPTPYFLIKDGVMSVIPLRSHPPLSYRGSFIQTRETMPATCINTAL